MSNNAFDFFYTPERNTSINLLNTQKANSMAMLNPTKMTSNVNFPSKSFTAVGAKPKGLSIRSQSDLNIAPSAKPASSLKVNEAKKSLLIPHKDKVSKIVLQKQKQGLSPNSKSPHKGVIPEFKRPLTPKFITKAYPPIEKLAGFYDYDENFDRVLRRAEALDKEAKVLSAAIRKPIANIIKPFEDDCEPSVTSIMEQDYPSLKTTNKDLICLDVEIPSLSDED